MTKCDAEWQSWRDLLRDGPKVLSQREVHELVGLVIREARETLGDNPGKPETIETALAHYSRLSKKPTPQIIDVLVTAWRGWLAKHRGWPCIAQESLDALVSQSLKDMPRAIVMRKAMADGDYSEPQWLASKPAAKLTSKRVPFSQLIEGWQKERSPKATSVRSMEARIEGFISFIGSDDAARITRADVQRWKDHLLSQGETPSPKGIKDKLDALRTLLKWSIANSRLPFDVNPAQDVRMALGRRRKKKVRRGFTDQEASAILHQARQAEGFARWGIWLMAYSGMRAGEAAQLRVQDIQQHPDGIWSITATEAAGTLKTVSSEREFPIHSAVLAEGLADYLASLPSDGRLFPELYAKAKAKGADEKVTQRARTRVRAMTKRIPGFTFTDDVAINHSWRHRFKTLCREHRINQAVSLAIMGHEEEGTSGSYGDRPSLKVQSEELERIPALILPGEPTGPQQENA